MSDLEKTLLFPAIRELKTGRYWSLGEGQNTVGRSVDSVVCFDDPDISRKHCTITLQAGVASVTADAERNPTLVNGTAIASPATLRHRDEIRVGERTLVYLTSASDLAAPATSPPFDPDATALPSHAASRSSADVPVPPQPKISAEDWYIARDGVDPDGPYSTAQIRARLANGTLRGEQLIFRQGLDAWKFVGSLPEFADLAGGAQALPVTPARSAPMQPSGHASGQATGQARSQAFSQLSGDAGQRPAIAPLGLRFGAMVIDNLLLGAVTFVLPSILVGILSAAMGDHLSQDEASLLFVSVAVGLYLVVATLYFTLLDSTIGTATIGKRVFSLQVTDLNGGVLPLAKSFVRAIARIACAIPFSLGFLPALASAQSQGLHDMVCGTVVVRRIKR